MQNRVTMLEEKCRNAKPVLNTGAIHVEIDISALQAQVAALQAQLAEQAAKFNDVSAYANTSNDYKDAFESPIVMSAEEQTQRLGLRANNLDNEDKSKGKGGDVTSPGLDY